MNWININVADLDSEEYLGADPSQRGTWLNLMRYCVGQENGGRIEGAKGWKDRKWQQIVRVTKREAGSDCGLWNWDGDDLVVTFYPVDKEEEVREKRERAKLNGSKGGRPKKTDVETQQEPTLVSDEKPTLDISAKAEGKGKEGEGKGKELPPNPQGGDEAKPESEKIYPEIVEKLWAIFPPKSRDRSSKSKLDEAIKKAKPRPSDSTLLASAPKWANCHDWTKDDGKYAPGCHRWVKERKWESEPDPGTGKPGFKGTAENLKLKLIN